jgi:hypothetical protein
MKNFRLFMTILFLLASLVGILLFAIFDNTIFTRALPLIKINILLAGVALFIFLALLTTGIVSNHARLEGSLINNGYFQLAILELFLLSAGLTWYWHYSQQPGQIVLRLDSETPRDFINLGVRYPSSGSVSMDTVNAPGELKDLPAGKYHFETFDQDVVYFDADIVLEPGETETLVIPVVLNVRTLAVETDPTGAEIWINGLQTSKSPYTFNILTGDTIILDLKMSGYEVYTDTLCLNENIDLGVIPLHKLFTVWVSSRYEDIGYRIYDKDDRIVYSSRGSRKLQLAKGRYRISYEIGEGQYDSKRFSLNYNSTVTIP